MPTKDAVTVKVNRDVMKELSSWDPRIVLFTPARNPITSLNGLSRDEIALWGGISLLKYCLQLFRVVGEPKEGGILFLDVENAFAEDSNKRLYITIDRYEDRVKRSGGVRIHFETAE